MAGFLDSKERVLDITLTAIGKRLMVDGELRFVYWSAFDDEVNYDPFIQNSGSLSADELDEAKRTKIEDPLVMEARSGYRSNNRAEEDYTNVYRPLYTIPPGQTTLPSATFLSPSASNVISVSQSQISGGFQRHDSTELELSLGFVTGSFDRNHQYEGFLITAYRSSSDGYTEVVPGVDSSGSIVYLNELKIK